MWYLKNANKIISGHAEWEDAEKAWDKAVLSIKSRVARKNKETWHDYELIWKPDKKENP
jgi:hypothetical protein